MALSVSSAQSIGSSISQQLTLQLAQRNADQAEVNARALKAQADTAQRQADQAQDDARTRKVAAQQADSDAQSAQRTLTGLQSAQTTQTQLSDVYQRVVNQNPAPAQSGTTPTVTPVPTASTVITVGRSTPPPGTLVNTVA